MESIRGPTISPRPHPFQLAHPVTGPPNPGGTPELFASESSQNHNPKMSKVHDPLLTVEGIRVMKPICAESQRMLLGVEGSFVPVPWADLSFQGEKLTRNAMLIYKAKIECFLVVLKL